MNTLTKQPELPELLATVNLSKNYLTFTLKDKTKIKIVVTDGSVNLVDLDTKVGEAFMNMLIKEAEKTKLKRRLMGQDV
jgi:predicted Kef-type K+ transport protein